MDFVILDVETTQNQITKKEEIIEFSAIKIDSKFQELSKLYYLINPKVPLTFITKKVTGITEKDLINKPAISEIIVEISEFLSSNKIIAHNAKFDKNAVSYAFEKNNLQKPLNAYIDSLKIAKLLFPDELLEYVAFPSLTELL